MNSLALIQAAQTATLATVAAAMIYALNLLRRELRQAAVGLREVLRGQKEMEERLNRMEKRIDALESARRV